MGQSADIHPNQMWKLFDLKSSRPCASYKNTGIQTNDTEPPRFCSLLSTWPKKNKFRRFRLSLHLRYLSDGSPSTTSRIAGMWPGLSKTSSRFRAAASFMIGVQSTLVTLRICRPRSFRKGAVGRICMGTANRVEFGRMLYHVHRVLMIIKWWWRGLQCIWTYKIFFDTKVAQGAQACICCTHSAL